MSPVILFARLLFLLLLWFLSGAGISYYLTRRTPFSRHFLHLSVFSFQLLVALAFSVCNLVSPNRISGLQVLGLHGVGFVVTAHVFRKIGVRGLENFWRYRLWTPIVFVLLAVAVYTVSPCYKVGGACYVQFNNDEYLTHFAGNAQWLIGRVSDTTFADYWNATRLHRFGADVLLAVASLDLNIAAAHAILFLQAIARAQYILCAYLFFASLTRLLGWRLKWGGLCGAILMAVAPVENFNYLMSWLAHQMTASALALLCATLTQRFRSGIIVLQGLLLIYIAVVYSEVLPVAVFLVLLYGAVEAIRVRRIAPLGWAMAECSLTFLTCLLRRPGLLSEVFGGLGANAYAGFPMFGNPAANWVHYVAALGSYRNDWLGIELPNNSTEIAAVLCVVIAVLAGAWLSAWRRRQYWIVALAAIIAAAHFNRSQLLHGRLVPAPIMYEGPKAFIYFHFIFVSLIVCSIVEAVVLRHPTTVSRTAPPRVAGKGKGGNSKGGKIKGGKSAATASSLPQRLPTPVPRPIALPGLVWLSVLLLMGVGTMTRIVKWPAVYDANGDKALVGEISRGLQPVLLTNLSGEEKYWQELLAYGGVTTKPVIAKDAYVWLTRQGTPDRDENLSGLSSKRFGYIVPQYEYDYHGGLHPQLNTRPDLCSETLASSQAFLLCGKLPSYWIRVVDVKAKAGFWGAESYPLLSCGAPGDAVTLGVRSAAPGRVVVFIEPWGSPVVPSAPIDLGADGLLELRAVFNAHDKYVAVLHRGETIAKAGVTSWQLNLCTFEGGRNTVNSSVVTREFPGEVTLTAVPGMRLEVH